MTWALVIGLGLAAFAAMVFVLRVPRGGWEVIGAALLLGLAGYALQGAPRLPSAPGAPAEKIAGKAAADSPGAIAQRQKLAAGEVGGDSHIIIADALARHGQFADAAEVLRGAVEKNPANAPAWLAMANALVAHADSTISPAAIYAFGRAAKAEPDSPAPPFFLGMALIKSGRLGEGRAVWANLLARTPAQAPWRADLAERLGELDAYLAREQAPGPAGMPGQ